MPPQLLLLLALAIVVFFIWLKSLPAKERQVALWRLLVPVGILLLILAVVTGRLHWIFAAVGTGLGLLRKLAVVSRSYAWLKGQSSHSNQRADSPEVGQPAESSMNETEAYAVLGLAPGASKEEIVVAYRRLMQRVHPDRGGSGLLTQKIIRAKEILLSDRA